MRERLDKIHSTGYWRVNIRPTRFEKEKIPSLTDCHGIIEQSKVQLRGWDYPHLDRHETSNGEDWIQSGCDVEDWGTIEYWRFYQSGQFIHHFACQEDYVVNPDKLPRLSVREPSPTGRYLEVISSLYRVTEIFEFAARLSTRGILTPNAEITIALFGTEGRQLFFWEATRLLFENYVCNIPEMKLDRIYPESELLASAHVLALDTVMWIFERFNWKGAPRAVLAEDQKKFLERRR